MKALTSSMLVIVSLSSSMANAACLSRSAAIDAVATAEGIDMPTFLKYTLPLNAPWGGPAYLEALASQPSIVRCISDKNVGQLINFNGGVSDMVNELLRLSSK